VMHNHATLVTIGLEGLIDRKVCGGPDPACPSRAVYGSEVVIGSK
jgi:hypothetical protein